MCKNSHPVVATSLENALSSFGKFIEQCNATVHPDDIKPIIVLIGHNSDVFDVPILLRSAGESYDQQLHLTNVHFGDRLPLMRSLLKSKHAPLKLSNGRYCRANIGSIYQCLFQDDFDAHDALEDVQALRKILFSHELGISTETIISNSHIKTVLDARADLEFLGKKISSFKHSKEIFIVPRQKKVQ